MAKAYQEKANTLSEYNRLKATLIAKQYHPIYLLEGEEGYYIDALLQYFDHHILDESQKDFNLLTLYGKDSEWSEVINACSRFPMFAEHTIVILREAMQLKKIEELIPYFEHPSPSTILVIDYRGKVTTSKDKWAKAVAQHGIIFCSHTLSEQEVPAWIQQYAAAKHYKVSFELAEMLAGYLGNDLQKISNELEKVSINEPNLKELNAALVEQYIGISRAYNYMDLPKVIFTRDTQRLSRMLSYFMANPKSAPLPPLIATFYTFADRIYRCYSVPDDFNNPESKALYYYRGYAKQFSITTIHRCIALLHELAIKAVGIDSIHKNDSELLKEMVGKLNAILYPTV